MSRRAAFVVAGTVGFVLGARLFAEQQERPSIADTPAGARRIPQGLTNDNCEDAIPILGGNTAYDTTGANTDGLPHEFCMFDGQTYHDIWFQHIPCSRELVISMCDNANYDTDVVVYDGCYPDIPCPPGDEHVLDCNDDSCPGFRSELIVPVVDGNCYTIRVGGWNDGDQGSAVLSVSTSKCVFCGDGVCEEDEDPCSCPVDCPGGCPCFVFFDQAEFEAFNTAQGRLLKGVEDFEESTLPPGSVLALDDPLCGGIPNVDPATGWGFPDGLSESNLCVQSNIDGESAPAPNPHGIDGLVTASESFHGPVSDIVVPDFFIDSLDLIFSDADHTAVGFDTISFLGTDSVHISVFDKNSTLVLTANSPANLGGSYFWGVSCSESIGRINIFDPGNGAEGGDNIQMWVFAGPCGSCPTDVDESGDTGAGDLAVLLGSWGPCAPGDPCECLDADSDGVIGAADLAVLLGAWGLCP